MKRNFPSRLNSVSVCVIVARLNVLTPVDMDDLEYASGLAVPFALTIHHTFDLTQINARAYFCFPFSVGSDRR